MEILKRLLKDEEGQGMVEYGIIISLISIVAVVAIRSVGKKTAENYTSSSQMMDAIPQKP